MDRIVPDLESDEEQYQQKCLFCEKEFIGHKREYVCSECIDAIEEGQEDRGTGGYGRCPRRE